MFEKLTDRLKKSYLRFKYDVRMAMFEASAETFFSKGDIIPSYMRAFHLQKMTSDMEKLKGLVRELGIINTNEEAEEFEDTVYQKFEDRYSKKR